MIYYEVHYCATITSLNYIKQEAYLSITLTHFNLLSVTFKLLQCSVNVCSSITHIPSAIKKHQLDPVPYPK
jgi:hypothetical protein